MSSQRPKQTRASLMRPRPAQKCFVCKTADRVPGTSYCRACATKRRMEAHKKYRPATAAQIRMMRAIRDHGDAFYGLRGMSAYGGAEGTLSVLLRVGWAEDGGRRLTAAGMAKLAKAEEKQK